ncbi:cupin domain-containing protein [Bacteroidota bacterium]
MINRNYREGEQLDVAGLNKIIVLIDRSETEITEVGWNCWTPKQDGPPHKHNDKDQVFYITGGVGKVRLGDKQYDVKPGNMVYVPAGLVHQTITTTEERLCYLLYNVFNNPDKEGHSTFAEHIEKVKQIRRQQADTGSSTVDEEKIMTGVKSSKFLVDIYFGKKYEFGSNSAQLLIDRGESNNTEVTLVSWSAGSKGAVIAHKEKEQTFFILKGNGKISVGEETGEVQPGNLVFVPRNMAHTTEAGEEGLTYLCMNAIIHPELYSSFDEMYNQVSAGRIERWNSGSNEAGE